MRVTELKNVSREENFIYYRRNFNATAVLEMPKKNLDVPFSFLIEVTPFGTKEISIFGLESVDYPLVPLQKALKEYILEQDSEGKLP